MKQKINVGSYTNNLQPRAYISISKNRQKVYQLMSNSTGSNESGTVYLPNQAEFEIELFNPTNEKVLAIMTLNGKENEKGFILKPGQRFFLDRHLNENKKLLFDVYEVSTTNSDVQKAIKNNGNVKVEFYKEKTYQNCSSNITVNYPVYPNITINPYPVYPTYPHNPFWYSTPIYCSSLSSSTASTGTGNINCCTTTTNATLGFVTLTSGVNHDSINVRSTNMNKKLLSNKMEETGRVDKGSQSDQSFKETEFISESSPIATVEYKLLPISKKPLTSNDIFEENKYCSDCGKLIKKNWKFCSFCGNKI